MMMYQVLGPKDTKSSYRSLQSSLKIGRHRRYVKMYFSKCFENADSLQLGEVGKAFLSGGSMRLALDREGGFFRLTRVQGILGRV